MKKIIVISSFNLPISGDPRPEILTKEWIDYRMSIFMKHTCKSFINQTNQSYLYLIRYDPSSEDIVRDTLKQYPPLPDNIMFIPYKSAGPYIQKLLNGYDYVYLVRIDCDDMYHPTFVQKLLDCNPDPSTQVLINQSGYIYDIKNNLLGDYHHFSPAFYTLVYKVDDYLSGNAFVFSGRHADAIKLNYEVLDGKNFVVIIHDRNTLMGFSCSVNKGQIDDPTLKKSILDEFNID